MNQLLLLEFNEINFESIEYYIALGKLPAFARAISRCGYCRTVSEHHYEELEPWIQWVSAHTGRNLEEHGVFRLGEIVNHEIPQIWEQLDEHGLKVGAVSPMNVKNRTRQAAFFVPDPWTDTEITGSTLTRGMSRAISQVVGDNAQGRLDAESVLWLLAGMVSNARISNCASYFSLAARSVRKR